MRKSRTFFIFITLLLVLVHVVPASAALSVQVRSSDLRDSPSFLGNRVAPVVYGDQVELLREQGPWMEVSTSAGKKGWIHQSALSKKRIAHSTGELDLEATVSRDELTLAGKGMTADVEEKFKEVNRDVDFTWVDRMEKFALSPREVVTFLKQGGLHVEGAQ